MNDHTPTSTDTDCGEVLNLLANTIESTHDRIGRKVVDSIEEQELLIKWIRAFGYLSGQYRRLLRDSDGEKTSNGSINIYRLPTVER